MSPEADEPTALEYARSHWLAVDHYSLFPVAEVVFQDLQYETCDDAADTYPALTNDSDVSKYLTENFSATKDVAALLWSTMKYTALQDPYSSPSNVYTIAQQAFMELPLMSTDESRTARIWRKRPDIDLETLCVSLQTEFIWPSDRSIRELDLAASEDLAVARIRTETLNFTKDVARYVANPSFWDLREETATDNRPFLGSIPSTPRSGEQQSSPESESSSPLCGADFSNLDDDDSSQNSLHGVAESITQDGIEGCLSTHGDVTKEPVFREHSDLVLGSVNSASPREGPIAVDRDCRVPVPCIESWNPNPPWQQAGLLDDVQAAVTAMFQEFGAPDLQSVLRTTSQVFDQDLLWNPFLPPLREVLQSFSFIERLEENVSDKLIHATNDKNTIESTLLLWKREGLRILDDSESDDELEIADLQETCHSRRSTNVNDWACSQTNGIPLPKSLSMPDRDRRSEDIFEELLPNDTDFIPAGLVDHFMETRGIASGLVSSDHRQDSPTIFRSPELDLPHEAMIKPMEHVLFPPSPDMAQDPLDGQYVPERSPPFIIATALIVQRNIMEHVERLYPNAHFIERQFEDAGTQTTSDPDPAIEEADLIISPSTGLICSTLKKANQLPLPGQRGLTGFRGRILRLKPRYETIFVLLRSQKDMPGTPSSAQVAFENFDAFARSISPNIHAIYVGSKDESLARWIASLMIQHGLQTYEGSFMQADTDEEQHLRRLGFNSYTAQIMLQVLHIPQYGKGGSKGRTKELTLQDFQDMPLEEKIRHFGPLLGGSHVLINANRSLNEAARQSSQSKSKLR